MMGLAIYYQINFFIMFFFRAKMRVRTDRVLRTTAVFLAVVVVYRFCSKLTDTKTEPKNGKLLRKYLLIKKRKDRSLLKKFVSENNLEGNRIHFIKKKDFISCERHRARNKKVLISLKSQN